MKNSMVNCGLFGFLGGLLCLVLGCGENGSSDAMGLIGGVDGSNTMVNITSTPNGNTSGPNSNGGPPQPNSNNGGIIEPNGNTQPTAGANTMNSGGGTNQPNAGGMAALPEPGGPNPGVGEIIFTEIMYNPKGADSASEWFEIHNVTNRPLSLEDCFISDETGEIAAGEMVLAPGRGRDSFAVYARSNDGLVLGNVTVDGVFEFTLNNNRDRLSLTCGGVVIDVVDYDIDFNASQNDQSFPLTDGFSIALDPTRETAQDNDVGRHWCVSRKPYIELPIIQYGTPGAQNSSCEAQVDECQLHMPLMISESRYRDVVPVFGRVRHMSLTDRSPINNAVGLIRGELGFGPQGIAPDDGDQWTWFYAAPDDDYNGNQSGQPDHDQYVAQWTIPRPGMYDYRFRFSVDGGRTWKVCDQPGQLSALPPLDPCSPNPCRSPQEAPSCDGNIATSYPSPGRCTPDQNTGLEACAYPPTIVDCAANGQVCYRGGCYDAAPTPPNVGEIVINELMYNPDDDPEARANLDPNIEPIREGNAEWIEVYNPTDQYKTLHQCELTDFDLNRQPNEMPTLIEDVVIAPNGFALFVRSDRPERNGGLTADHRFYFNLTNSGDTVRLRCGQTLVDEVVYADNGANRGLAQGQSIVLDPQVADSMTNDDPRAWCLASDADQYLAVPRHTGTPGQPNPPCDRCARMACNEPPASFCNEEGLLVSFSPQGICQSNGIDSQCTYMSNAVACENGFECIDGGCMPNGARSPRYGDLIISEIMADPVQPVEDRNGEWFEIHNLSDEPLSLSGCTVADAAMEARGLARPERGAYIASRGYLTFVRNPDPAVNGGILGARPFTFGLTNAGDEIVLTCNMEKMDRVNYAADGFVMSRPGVSLQLSSSQLSPENNDLPEAWCHSVAGYPINVADPAQLGTPGNANVECPQ